MDVLEGHPHRIVLLFDPIYYIPAKLDIDLLLAKTDQSSDGHLAIMTNQDLLRKGIAHFAVSFGRHYHESGIISSLRYILEEFLPSARRPKGQSHPA